MLISHPLVTIVERKDTFAPIVRSWIVYQRPSNGKRIFLHLRWLKFGFEGLICLRSLLTLCWKIKLHKCVWPIIKSLDQGWQAPTPSAAMMILSGGVEIERELMHPDWQKLLDDFLFVNYEKKGRERCQTKGRTRSLETRSSEEVRDNVDLHVLIANFLKNSMYFEFYFG